MPRRKIPTVIFVLFSSLVILRTIQVMGRDPLHTAINGPCRLAFDSKGDLYVSEEDGNHIFRIDWTQNKATVVAGNGKKCCFKENALARESSIYYVYSIAFDAADNLYMGGRNHDDDAFIRVVDKKTRRIRYFVKGRSPVSARGVPLLEADVSEPKGIVSLRSGALLVSTPDQIVELGKTAVTFAGIPDRMDGVPTAR